MCCYTHPLLRVMLPAWAAVIGWVGVLVGGMLNRVECQSEWGLATFGGRTCLFFIPFFSVLSEI